jgi:hypothetical protein
VLAATKGLGQSHLSNKKFPWGGLKSISAHNVWTSVIFESMVSQANNVNVSDGVVE